MGMGMVGSGTELKRSALQSMQRYSSLDQKLKADNEAMKQADEASTKSTNMAYGGMAGTVAGMAIGGAATSWSGPGMMVGAAVGALVGTFAGDMF